MTSLEQAQYAIRNWDHSTLLFEQYQSEKYELRSWVKIRTHHRRWRQGWLFPSRKELLRLGFQPHSNSSSPSTPPTSGYPRQFTVICQRGQDRESFSGTQYRVANQVILYLTTGMSGDILRAKSSTDLMKMVALSSYSSALLRLRSETRSTSEETVSLGQAILRHAGLDPASPPSPDQESSRPSTRSSLNWKNRS